MESESHASHLRNQKVDDSEMSFIGRLIVLAKNHQQGSHKNSSDLLFAADAVDLHSLGTNLIHRPRGHRH